MLINEFHIKVKPSEVVSGAQVAENSAAPPIDSSIALPDQQTSAVPDAVQASSISDYEVNNYIGIKQNG